MYHDVYAETPAAGMPRTAGLYHVSRDTFRRHLEALRASGLPVVTASESLARNAASGDHLVLTFDDGWEESLTVGVECLLEAGMRATFFVTRDYVGRPRFASPAMLLEARRAGMEIGSHGCTHRPLGELDEDEIRSELRGSKVFLEELLGEPVTTSSVPDGSWSPLVARLAREAGYSGLCTSRPGVNRSGEEPFRLRRLAVRSRTDAATVRRWTRFSVAGPVLRGAALDIPRRVLGARRYAALRRRLLGARSDDV
jgi:peptidoglycan/xylan/chitin deacetylase (PgdA/CDA1 family)